MARERKRSVQQRDKYIMLGFDELMKESIKQSTQCNTKIFQSEKKERIIRMVINKRMNFLLCFQLFTQTHKYIQSQKKQTHTKRVNDFR